MVENFDWFSSLKYFFVEFKVFIEKGFYMLVIILRSLRVIVIIFVIIELFFKLRILVWNVNIMVIEYDEEKRKSLV